MATKIDRNNSGSQAKNAQQKTQTVQGPKAPSTTKSILPNIPGLAIPKSAQQSAKAQSQSITAVDNKAKAASNKAAQAREVAREVARAQAQFGTKKATVATTATGGATTTGLRTNGGNANRSNTTTTNRNTGKNIQIEFAPGGKDSRLMPGAGPKGTGDPAPEFDPPRNIVLIPRRNPEDLPKDENKNNTPASPLSVAESYSTPAPRPTLIPGRDVVELAAPQVSAESMEQLLFQQLSSFEIVNLARRDTIEGLNPYYSVISNLSSIREEYNPSQIISLQKPAQGLSDLYQIKLSDKIPNDAYLTRNNITNFFYIDNNGDFIIELDNMLVDEVIEIQIATSGKIT